MTRGVFSDDFTTVFADQLEDLFGLEFPSRSGNAPDPQVSASEPETPASPGAVPVNLPADDFDFGLPVSAAPEAVAATTVVDSGAVQILQSAVAQSVVSNGIPMEAGGRPADKGPGGGNGGDPVLAATYISGAGDVDGIDYFNIQIQFFGDWDFNLMEAFGAAADFLSSVITQGLVSDPLAFYSFDNARNPSYFEVDDLMIEAYLTNIDGEGGVLGQAGPYSIRSASDPTTVVGVMEFDIADALQLDTLNSWDATVLHEMLHVLGLGTLWSYSGVVGGTSRGKDPYLYYTGEAGLAEYHAEGNTGDLLIETDGGRGTAGGHWDDDTYINELMTGYLWSDTPLNESPPVYLADWTIMSLNDIGYSTVDLAATGANALASGIDLDDVSFDNELYVVDGTLIDNYSVV